MADLMKTPSNRRYVINFQQKEPLNKYDIWLSCNKHKSGNEDVVDSPYLSDKDLVFKVFINDKWVPILSIPISYDGIMEELEKKMNIVDTFAEGHIPVFKRNDGCNQLVDGGSFEELFNEMVLGGATIPISRASTASFGGVKAGVHSNVSEKEVFIEAKFKSAAGSLGENDRLYVLASDVVSAINNYESQGGGLVSIPVMTSATVGGAKAASIQSFDVEKYIPVLINTSDENLYVNGESVVSILNYIVGHSPSLNIYTAGEGIAISNGEISNILADDDHIGGVKVRSNTLPNADRIGAEIMYGDGAITDAASGNVVDANHLCIGAEQITAILKEQDPEDPNFYVGAENGLYGRFQNVGTVQAPEYIPTLGVNGVIPENIGKYAKCVSSLTSESGADISWETISGGTAYPSLAQGTAANTECVVVAPEKKTGFLRGDGSFVAIEAGNSFSITPTIQTGTKIADYVLDNVGGSLYAPSSIYSAGNGIYIDSGNRISIDTTNAVSGYVLGYNGSTAAWVPQRTYTAGNGIDIDQQNVLSGKVTDNSSTAFTATSRVTFRAMGSGSIVRQAVVLRLDGSVDGTPLYPYNYYEVTIDLNGPAALEFEIGDQLELMQGDPVYALLAITGETNTVTVSVSDSDRPRFININNAVVSGELNSNYTHFLITMQFGIVKIEPLETTVTNPNENENENDNENEEAV